MTCGEARELFSALVDEALGPDERAVFDRHLAGCTECREDLQRFTRLVSLVRAVEPERAPVGFVDRVLDQTGRAPWYRRLARWLVFPLPVKLPLGAAAAVLVGVLVSLLYRQSPELQHAARRDAAPAPPAVEAPVVGQAPAAPGSRDTPGRVAEPSAPAPRSQTETQRQAPKPAPMKDNRESGRRSETAPERKAKANVTAGKKDAAAPDLAGSLIVADLADAQSALGALVSRAGGRETGHRPILDGFEVEVEIPRARADEFARELPRIGRWQAAQPLESPGDPVRALIRLVR